MRRFLIFSILLLGIVPFATAKIVFMSKWEIYMMDDDGTNVQRLTFNNLYDSSPSWSPDGKYIAFEREQERKTNEQNHDLFIMNADGTQERKLTTYTGLDLGPNWSPDNQHISFTSTRGGNANIYIIDVKTKEIIALTRNIKDATMQHASWSPDGKQIAYVVTQRNPFLGAIYIVDLESRNTRSFIRNVPALFYAVNWSPDGKHILYGEEKHGNNGIISDKLFIRTLNGRLVKEIKLPPIKQWVISGACWMGTQHVLLTAVNDGGRGQYDILRYTIATDKIVNLTNSPGVNDGFPDWIDDTSLAVSPSDKLAILWGLLKKTD